jgi:hypothetical protein
VAAVDQPNWQVTEPIKPRGYSVIGLPRQFHTGVRTPIDRDTPVEGPPEAVERPLEPFRAKAHAAVLGGPDGSLAATYLEGTPTAPVIMRFIVLEQQF